jgi:hypothetical protein
MTDQPQDDFQVPAIAPAIEPVLSSATPAFDPAPAQANAPLPIGESAITSAPAPLDGPVISQSSAEPELFQSYMQPPVRRPTRIPNFGHLLLFSLLLLVAFGILTLVLGIASYFHLFGWQLSAKAATDIGFNLSFEASTYLITFAFSLLVFPMVWNQGYFQGLQWRGHAARDNFWPLAGIALTCFVLAIFDQVVLPGPSNAPIEKMISSPSAAWVMFAFGVTVAPFFEEMSFRGFLLPALSTAYDWVEEKIKHAPPRPLDANGHPQWSMPAMIVASIATSIPFALLHREQQGYSLGPFLLLIVVSTILCAVRLKTRSLAASTLVHASYNLLIFSVELIVTGGFRHFDKL